ncbi:hypothetical protein PMAYCL1PPCAC_21317, partial [Pristionchus mayeri]
SPFRICTATVSVLPSMIGRSDTVLLEVDESREHKVGAGDGDADARVQTTVICHIEQLAVGERAARGQSAGTGRDDTEGN